MNRQIHSGIRRFAIGLALTVFTCTLQAGSATWNLNPSHERWHTIANWTPATVPNSESDIATFGVSNITKIRLTEHSTSEYCADGLVTTLDKLVFDEGASSYTVTVIPDATVCGAFLEIVGDGVINNSGVVQNIVVAASGDWRRSAWLTISNDATIGDNVVIINQGGASPDGDSRYGAATSVGWDIGSTVNAGSAMFINEGSTASGTIFGGFTNISNYSGAENATFINNPGTVSGAAAGHTLIQTFLPGGNLGTSTFIANPATVPGAEGGWVEMDVGTCAGTSFIANGASVADCQAGQIYAYGAENGTGLGVATFTANGGNGTNAQGGLIDVFNLPLSDQTSVIANPGTNGGLGGTILIEGDPPLDPCQFQVFGNGALDLTNARTRTGISIGSLSGDGDVLLAGNCLIIGTNNLDTTFSGVIQNGTRRGSVAKVGDGTLTLSGANTYTGGTTVSAGTLEVANTTGSATGTNAVTVAAGTLGGTGTIQGAATIGTGNGTGAVLAPSVGENETAILKLKKTLTFKADSTYTCQLDTNNSRSDQVSAKGVTIESGAQFTFQPIGARRLRAGRVFTVISNTSATPVTGTFSNLADGSTFTSGSNTYQVSYEGGTGNDLTLAVAP